MKSIKKLQLLIISLFLCRYYYFQIKPYEFFSINDDLGSAGFMKLRNNKAKCINSSDAAFDKIVEYYIQEDQIVKPTSRNCKQSFLYVWLIRINRVLGIVPDLKITL